jgi:hypothetical protein
VHSVPTAAAAQPSPVLCAGRVAAGQGPAGGRCSSASASLPQLTASAIAIIMLRANECLIIATRLELKFTDY